MSGTNTELGNQPVVASVDLPTTKIPALNAAGTAVIVEGQTLIDAASIGAVPVIQNGTVATGEPGSEATLSFDVTNPAKPVFSGSVPQGIQGVIGPIGATPQITATAAPLAAGANPTVVVSGSAETPQIAFGLPAAPSPVMTAGTTTTLPNGQPAAVEIDNTNPLAPLLNISLPEGATGQTGPVGPPVIQNLLSMQGGWNASTNTPTLVSSTGAANSAYYVTTAGTTSLNGIASWAINDVVAFVGGAWIKLTGYAAATAVASLSVTGSLSVPGVVVTPLNLQQNLLFGFVSPEFSTVPLFSDTSGKYAASIDRNTGALWFHNVAIDSVTTPAITATLGTFGSQLLQPPSGAQELPLYSLISDITGKVALGVDTSGHLGFTPTAGTVTKITGGNAPDDFERSPKSGDTVPTYASGSDWVMSDGRIYTAVSITNVGATWQKPTTSFKIWSGGIAAGAPQLPGDAIIDSPFAFVGGLRRMVANYNGPAINVGRDTDSTALDIVFMADGNIDWRTMVAFAPTGKIRVNTVYDQSGHGNNLTYYLPGNAKPVIAPFPQIGVGSFGIVIENDIPYNGTYEPSEGLTIPPAVVVDGSNFCVLGVWSFQTSAAEDIPMVELFSSSGGNPLGFGKVRLTGADGLYAKSGTAQKTSTYEPPLMAQVAGFNSTSSAFTIVGSDREQIASAALVSTPLAGGVIGQSPSGYIAGAGSAAYPGGCILGGLIITTRGLTPAELTLQRQLLSAAYGLRPQIRGDIYFDGDSITNGAWGTYFESYPRRIGAMLRRPARIFNFAVSGSTAAAQTTNFSRIINSFDATAPYKIYYLSVGTNDIGASAPFGIPATIYATMQGLLGMARALGFTKLVVSTVRPRTAFEGNGGETARQALNALIRAGVGTDFDVLVDYDTFAPLGAYGAFDSPVISPDGTHETDYARQLEAQFITPILDGVVSSLGF